MAQCTQCEHELGIGRFCTNCGHPVTASTEEASPVDPGGPADVAGHADWRTDTAERPATPADPASVPPEHGTPPPAYRPPPQARYPLFADQLDDEDEATKLSPRVGAAPAVPPLSEELLSSSDSQAEPARRGMPERRGLAVLPYFFGAVVLVLIAGLGVVLLTFGGDDTDASARDAPASQSSVSESSDGDSPSTAPSTAPSTTPSSSPPSRKPQRKSKKNGKPVDVARTAKVSVPDTAPPSRDVQGNAVRYQAFNMLDGVSNTAWRMPGSAAGTELMIRLKKPTQVRSVGMINGYAKVEPGYDGYSANRRIKRVEWVFDDGTTLAQKLGETTDVQTIKVPKVTTSKLRLRIVDVSNPGPGKQGRNFTAISDLSITGVAQR